jgi:hypothetical protein
LSLAGVRPATQDVLLRHTAAGVVLLQNNKWQQAAKKRLSRNIIGNRIREARQFFDPPLTQDQLAGRLAKVGIQLDRVALAKVENGLRCAFDFEVKALAAVLKVDANWLLGTGGRSQVARKVK